MDWCRACWHPQCYPHKWLTHINQSSRSEGKPVFSLVSSIRALSARAHFISPAVRLRRFHLEPIHKLSIAISTGNLIKPRGREQQHIISDLARIPNGSDFLAITEPLCRTGSKINTPLYPLITAVIAFVRYFFCGYPWPFHRNVHGDMIVPIFLRPVLPHTMAAPRDFR